MWLAGRRPVAVGLRPERLQTLDDDSWLAQIRPGHQGRPRTVLRSQYPELVLQEIWGHLCCHFAIRSLMTDAATHSPVMTQTWMSFVAALDDHPPAASPPWLYRLTTSTASPQQYRLPN